MSNEGWSSSTFEVLTAKGGRWLIDMTSAKRSEAMEHAEALLAKGTVEGVRVKEMRDGWPQEKVLLERALGAGEKPLTIVAVADVALCEKLISYYALPARLTMGRILRAYLDRQGLTAMELLFNAAHLRALDRMDKYFPSAMQHVAQLHAKHSGETKMARMEKLSTVFETVLARARKTSDFFDKYARIYAEHGLDRALVELKSAVPSPAEMMVARYGLVASILSGNPWREKLKLAVDMAETSIEPDSIDLADEAIAEILDGQLSVLEIFGSFATPIAAWKTYVTLSSGSLTAVPKYMSPDLERLNDLFCQLDLPQTRDVLLKRISRGLGSTQAMSKDGPEADRTSFIGLVRELTEPTGIHGGPQMVEAVVLRVKSLLGEDGQDLPIDTAIRQALYLMPSQAARLGVLLDLTSSDLGRKHDGLVRKQLIGLLDQLRTIYDLFPTDSQEAERIQGIECLRDRLGMSALSDELKASLTASLGKMEKGEPEAEPTPAPPEPVAQVQGKPQVNNGELQLEAGDILFNEDEPGTDAFLIIEGGLEIFRIHNGEKQHLATLGRGEIIGEMSLIDNQPRMASACATEPSVLMAVSQSSLQDRLSKLAESDKVLHMLMRTLVRRLRGIARVTD